MTDLDLRELERKGHGDPAARVALLKKRLRAGKVSGADVMCGAYLGVAEARVVAPQLGEAFGGSWETVDNVSLEAWADCLLPLLADLKAPEKAQDRFDGSCRGARHYYAVAIGHAVARVQLEKLDGRACETGSASAHLHVRAIRRVLDFVANWLAEPTREQAGAYWAPPGALPEWAWLLQFMVRQDASELPTAFRDCLADDQAAIESGRVRAAARDCVVPCLRLWP